jgi:hypothetical protein
MSDTYNNYQNKFIQLANLKVGGIPENLKFAGNEFIIKNEFHITLLAVERIARIIESDNVENLKLEIVDEFNKFVAEHPLTEYRLLDDVRLVTVDNNKTIVVIAELQGIESLFDRLSKKYKVELPVQPAHITLYTLPTDTFGIPIFSYEHLSGISETVQIPELQDLDG